MHILYLLNVALISSGASYRVKKKEDPSSKIFWFLKKILKRLSMLVSLEESINTCVS